MGDVHSEIWNTLKPEKVPEPAFCNNNNSIHLVSI